MFEKLEQFDKTGKLLQDLKPLHPQKLKEIIGLWNSVPEDYLTFLAERGSGNMDGGFHFVFLGTPLDAESQVFRDNLIYQHGAKGPVCVFGHDNGGRCFGFDLGDSGAILEIDEYRVPRRINLPFKEFVVELLANYPQTPKAERKQ